MTRAAPSPFPVSLLRPTGGELTARIAGHSLQDESPSLNYHIVVNLAPFTLDGVPQDTAIQLFTIPLDVRSWRQLSRHVAVYDDDWQLMRVEDGENERDMAVGSLTVSGEFVPVTLDRLAFGGWSGGAIETTLDMTVDGTPLGYTRTPATLRAALTVGGVQVRGDESTIAIPKAEEARELAAAFLDLDDYDAGSTGKVVTYFPKR